MSRRRTTRSQSKRAPSPPPSPEEEELPTTPQYPEDDSDEVDAAELEQSYVEQQWTFNPPFSVLSDEPLTGRKRSAPASNEPPAAKQAKTPLASATGRRSQRPERSPSPTAKRAGPNEVGTWITPEVDVDNFKELDLILDNDTKPHVNWWDPLRRYPRTMGQLAELEMDLTGTFHSQLSQWNVRMARPPTAPLLPDQLDVMLIVEVVENPLPSVSNSSIPGTDKTPASKRIASRILSVAKKQLERRREITNNRLKREKFERGGALDDRALVSPTDVVVRLPKPSYGAPASEVAAPEAVQTAPDIPVDRQIDLLRQLIWKQIRGGNTPFPADQYNAPEVLNTNNLDESDSILSVTPIDGRRKYFATNRYRKLKPIDFQLQIHMPAWVDAEQHLDPMLDMEEFKDLRLMWIGIPGDYRVIAGMADAPHDAAYHYAKENSGQPIDQHTRQWFITVNFNKTRAQITAKDGRSPEQMSLQVQNLLSFYDPEIVRHTLPAGGDFPMPLGSVREWKVLYAGSEIAPRTGYWHMHLLVSITYIRFGPMQVRLHYPKLTQSLQKICDVAYFHAIGVKTPFPDDPTATSRDEKRLKDYIEKNREFFAGPSEELAANVNRDDNRKKRLQR